MECTLTFRSAERKDVPLILEFIRALAEYEHMADQVVATEEDLDESLFQHPVCHLSEPVRIGNRFLGGIRLTHQFIRIPIPSSLRKIVVQEVSAFAAAEEAMARQRPGKLRCRKLRGRF